MCYPSPESREKKFSSPGAGKAKMITVWLVWTPCSPMWLRPVCCKVAKQCSGRRKKDLWKGPLTLHLVLASVKGESKALPLTWHMCQQEGQDAGSVLVSPMHYKAADMGFLGYFTKTFWTPVESNRGPVAIKLERMYVRNKKRWAVEQPCSW